MKCPLGMVCVGIEELGCAYETLVASLTDTAREAKVCHETAMFAVGDRCPSCGCNVQIRLDLTNPT